MHPPDGAVTIARPHAGRAEQDPGAPVAWGSGRVLLTARGIFFSAGESPRAVSLPPSGNYPALPAGTMRFRELPC